ncbi:dTDP-glucose 4,6-dehydratase [Methylopila jiangsuensis]|uniref:dTDP-glucose 4,6-dehydratase n=1 Tax=Methylopila jiangsuensis TaxID=586230 RepID=A0A9W6JDN6_9HYPH|nr:PhoX family phosphatase [Methylopila jiangsuensis]MDR6285888.1 hypothetical protein [Methylopila jiangsuensis]GLK75646.1 dTDP-glucose 4,6-dehydratase [Methylopila jiangsuensis]
MSQRPTAAEAARARAVAAETCEIEGVDRPGLHADAGARPANESFAAVLGRHLHRRAFLAGAAGAAAVPVLLTAGEVRADATAAGSDPLAFAPIAPSKEDRLITPEGYDHQVLIRWGDPLFEDAPEFDAGAQTPEAQRRQFGFNNDFVGVFPVEGGPNLLLVANHEYTSGEDMFAPYEPGVNRAQAEIEMAAHGGSVVEIAPGPDGWRVARGSRFNRRIDATTPMAIAGPAAGHRLLRTAADPEGRTVLGMVNNCSGGKTPWGTWLTCEENFNYYFANAEQAQDPDLKAVHARYGVSRKESPARWEAFFDRFDVTKEPHEAFRFGWVVEIDPYDPAFQPVKRTALGRMKHEAATTALAKDGRVAVYTGDDQQFDYVYKFVSSRAFDPADRKAGFGLLDEGTLHVARFHDDGTGEWLPLTIDNPALKGRFADQGEILIKTRLAADAVGATAMDRPEDVQPNPVGGKVYMTMTNNSKRPAPGEPKGADAANPRVANLNGHIIELVEDGGDHGATRFRWSVFLLCGDPAVDLKTKPEEIRAGLPTAATFYAGYADPSTLSKIAYPDNIAFDPHGNLWIATDGQPKTEGIGAPNDALHAVPTEGPHRGHLRQFLSAPSGAEVCGPEFTDDGRTLFCAIQHPGEGGLVPNKVSSWPDGESLPRPAVVAIRRKDGGLIGG